MSEISPIHVLRKNLAYATLFLLRSCTYSSGTRENMHNASMRQQTDITKGLAVSIALNASNEKVGEIETNLPHSMLVLVP